MVLSRHPVAHGLLTVPVAPDLETMLVETAAAKAMVSLDQLLESLLFILHHGQTSVNQIFPVVLHTMSWNKSMTIRARCHDVHGEGIDGATIFGI
jgi:hypothetical protein